MAVKIVLANGCFDVFHVGHLYHLRAARELGDVLVVGLTRDGAVNKGPGRPAFKWADRAALLRELRCVDYVLPVDSSLEALQVVRPAMFVKGLEYRGKILPEDRAFCHKHGIEIRFTDEPVHSSTALLRALA